MFENQGELCADTFNPSNGECGVEDYNVDYFTPVIENCTSIAGFSDTEMSSLSSCAIDPTTGLMSQEGTDLLLNSFSVSATADPIHQSLWVYIEGKQLFSNGYETLSEWGIAVRETVCSTYAAKNNTDLPEACTTV